MQIVLIGMSNVVEKGINGSFTFLYTRKKTYPDEASSHGSQGFIGLVKLNPVPTVFGGSLFDF